MKQIFFVLCLSVIPMQAMAIVTPANVITTQIVSGLTDPNGVYNAGDNSNRLFVSQKTGELRVVKNGVLLAQPLLTVDDNTMCRDSVSSLPVATTFSYGYARGLLGVAFHPNFESNGQLFLSYTTDFGNSILTRITMSDPQADVANASDLDSCLVILRVNQDLVGYTGGNILFNQAGYLYYGLGDGGGYGSINCSRGQTLNPANLIGASSGGMNADCDADDSFLATGGNPNSRALLGKMLRLDINNTTPAGANGLCGSRLDGSANYAIPASNPFAGADAQSACDEVFLYGLRNPWRFSFDRLTGDLFFGDFGNARWLEVNFLPAASIGGQNFGWEMCEGTHLVDSCLPCGVAGLTPPIIEYKINGVGGAICPSPTSGGQEVVGGYRYRGPHNALQGAYFYGDYQSPGLLISNLVSGSWSQPMNFGFALTLAPVRSFGESENGHLFYVSGGSLFRIDLFQEIPLFMDGFEENYIFSDGFE